MRRLGLIAAAMLAAAQVSAGVRIETVSRDIKTQAADGGADVVLVQDGMVRSNHAKSSGSTTIIKDGVFYELDDKKKTYYVMDEAAVKKVADEAAEVVKEMQERVKNMQPEQRAMMEESLGEHMPSVFGKKIAYVWKDTGKSETVEGRECRVWNLLKNDAVHEQYCVVPYASLPGNEDFGKVVTELWDAFEASAAGLVSVTDYVDARQAIDGYPLRIRSFDNDGRVRPTEHVLTKWVEESLPASTFAIPPGYKKKAPPKAGR